MSLNYELQSESLYSIGKLSKTVGISTDTLRYYDEIGLFKPAYTSGDTGYRYYTSAQAAALARILELKEYGFSLSEIKTILAEDGGGLAAVYQNRYWQLLMEKRKLQAAIDKLSVKIKNNQEGRFMGKRILLVDDADFMRTICRDILSRAGYEIAGEAKNGTEAADLFHSLSPDLVLMDIVMPVCDGIFALQQIKESGADINAVMLSAMGQARIVTEALTAGANGFIVKPFQPETLLTSVDGAFRERRAYSHEILTRIHDECGDVNYILSQPDIDAITQAAQNGGGADIEELIRRLRFGALHGAPDMLHDRSEENNVNTLTMLNKISQGQDEIKTLLTRLIEK